MRFDPQNNKEAAIAVIKAAAAKVEGTFISREKIEAFTGGAIKARHLANLDSRNEGVPGAFKVGRRQCYPIDSLVTWLINRLEVKP
jgi:hypothetical protein